MGDTVLFLSSARAAAFHAVRHFGLRAPDRVLVPSYHCGVEVEAILRAGAAAEYYPIGRDMYAQVEALSRAMRGHVKALLLVHYWGFPQDVREIAGLCRERGIVLIEDCAHALLSNDGSIPLGTAGEAALFSLPKTLSVPDGGILRLKGRAPAPSHLAGAANWVASKAGIRSVLERQQIASRMPVARMADALLGKPRRRPTPPNAGLPDHGETPLCMYERRMSSLSRYVLARLPVKEIRSRRRDNYSVLLSRLERTPGLDVVFERLEPGVCPLFLPVLVRDRNGLERYLRARGIETFVFGRIPHCTLVQEEYPDATYLAGHVLGLPIHQDLDEDDMQFIAEAVQRWPGV